MWSDYIWYSLLVLYSFNILVHSLSLAVPKQLIPPAQSSHGLNLPAEENNPAQTSFHQLEAPKRIRYNHVKKNPIDINHLVVGGPHVDQVEEQSTSNNISKSMLAQAQPQVPAPIKWKAGDEQDPVASTPTSLLASNFDVTEGQQNAYGFSKPKSLLAQSGKEPVNGSLESQILTTTAEPLTAIETHHKSNKAENFYPIDKKPHESDSMNKVPVVKENPVPNSMESESRSTSLVMEEANDQKSASAVIVTSTESNPMNKLEILNQVAQLQRDGKFAKNPNVREEEPQNTVQATDGSVNMGDKLVMKNLDEKQHNVLTKNNKKIDIGHEWKPFSLDHGLLAIKGDKVAVIDGIHSSKLNREAETPSHQSSVDGIALEYMLMVFSVILILILLVWRRFWYTICTTCYPRAKSVENPTVAFKVGYRPLINRN